MDPYLTISPVKMKTDSRYFLWLSPAIYSKKPISVMAGDFLKADYLQILKLALQGIIKNISALFWGLWVRRDRLGSDFPVCSRRPECDL